jgi:AcrR family transcriptional regulator
VGLEDRRKRERENRKGSIIKAARKLFLEKGFKAVTVESIAHKAELSKGAIYLHYSSKEEIYAHIVLSDLGKFHDRFSGLAQKPTNASRALFKFADIYVDFFLNEREFFRNLMNFMIRATGMNFPDELYEESIKTMNKTIDIVEEIFAYGVAQGEFPGTMNLRQNRNALWGMLNGIISLYIFTGNEEKRDDVIRSTVKKGMETFVSGLKSAEGSV